MWYNERMTYKQKILLASGIALLAMLAIIFYIFRVVAPDLWSLLVHRQQDEFIAYVRSFGWQGVVILFVLQALQTIAPFFPALLLQLAAGIAYGWWWGTLILMAGYTLANLIVFVIVRRLRPARLRQLLSKFKPLAKITNFCLTYNANTVVFSLYLFPFLSNGFVPYLAAMTKISLPNFLFSMICACLPGMFVSVYVGDRLVIGDYWAAAIAFSLGIVFSLVAYFLKDRILDNNALTKRSGAVKSCSPK